MVQVPREQDILKGQKKLDCKCLRLSPTDYREASVVMSVKLGAPEAGGHLRPRANPPWLSLSKLVGAVFPAYKIPCQCQGSFLPWGYASHKAV